MKTPKKPYPLSAVITADVLLLAVSLSAFCYFHHIKSLWGIGAENQLPETVVLQTEEPAETEADENITTAETPAEEDDDFRASLPNVFLPAAYEGMIDNVTLSEHSEIAEYIASEGLHAGHELDFDNQEYIGLYRSRDIFMTAEKIDTTIHYNNKTYDVAYYLYDVYVANLENLFTAHVPSRVPIEEMASASYGITTSDGKFVTSPAILSVNGDYLGNDNHALFAVRNGILVRDSDYIGADICVLYEDGTMETVSRTGFRRDELLENNPYQIWEFGPSLLDKDGKALYDFNESYYDDNVISNRHPRSSIGYFEPGHYCFIVVDGRSEDSKGVRLFQLGEIYEKLGTKVAYNFDGGDSAQSLWNGEKHRIDESRHEDGDDQRKLYDIVSIAEVSSEN